MGSKGKLRKRKFPKGSSRSKSGTSAKSFPSGKPKTGPSLSPEKLEALKRDGKCFRCEKEGHMSKDCPSRSGK